VGRRRRRRRKKKRRRRMNMFTFETIVNLINMLLFKNKIVFFLVFTSITSIY
jgi:hypothetical protein